MSSTADAVNRLLLSGKYHTILSIVKGFRNGAVYGAKVRLPHSLVMTLLFKRGSLKEMSKGILEATFTHSKNLALFVFLYKSLTSLMSWLQSEKIELHSFVAAFVGGYIVFGRYNKVNEQINLYLLSRIIYGLAKLGVKKGYIPKPEHDTFPWFAAGVWGIVLWMFEHHTDTLQPSLKSSMTYLYNDSNKWNSFKNYLVYNK